MREIFYNISQYSLALCVSLAILCMLFFTLSIITQSKYALSLWKTIDKLLIIIAFIGLTSVLFSYIL